MEEGVLEGVLERLSEGVLEGVLEGSLEGVLEGVLGEVGLVRDSPKTSAASCKVDRELTKRIPLSKTATGMVRYFIEFS